MRISDWSSDVCSSDLQCQMSGAEPAAVLRQIFRGNDEQWLVVRVRIGESLAGMKTLRPLCALQTAGPRRNRAVGIGTGVGANRGQLAARYRRNTLSGPGAANRNRVAAESATEQIGR